MSEDYILRIDYKLWNAYSLYSCESKEQRLEMANMILGNVPNMQVGYIYNIKNNNKLAAINIIGSKHMSVIKGKRRESSFKKEIVDNVIRLYNATIHIPLQVQSSNINQTIFQLQISYIALQQIISIGFPEVLDRSTVIRQLRDTASRYNATILSGGASSIFYEAIDIGANKEAESNFHHLHVVSVCELNKATWIIKLDTR